MGSFRAAIRAGSGGSAYANWRGETQSFCKPAIGSVLWGIVGQRLHDTF